MGIPFHEIVTGFELAREPGILNDAAAATVIPALAVVAHMPLNGTHKSMIEPNEEDCATDVKELGTGTTVRVALCAFVEQMLTTGE